MTFTIHRGANEIGGSCVEVCSATTRIVIDIGMPLVNPDGSDFDSSRTQTMTTEDLIKEKILPNIPSLYHPRPSDDKETVLLISHAHQDHYGLVAFVEKTIPVHLGKATHTLIELSAVFNFSQKAKENRKVIENPHYFESYQSFAIGDFEITPYLMDHASFDAYAFLLRMGGKSLLYTGDFRAHGRKWKSFYKFLHIAPKKVDYLLMEGTSLSQQKQRFKTETQLEEQFAKTFRETRGINMVYLSGQNIDRLVTVFRACKKCGKLFVIDFYIAYVLTAIAELGYGVPYPSPDFPAVRVFFPVLLKKRMEHYNRTDLISRFAQYEIGKEEIYEKSGIITMTVRPSMRFDIREIGLKGGTLVYSLWEGYKKNETTEQFLSMLIDRGADIATIHTSGHADYAALKKMLDELQPKELVPIHTLAADQYQKLFPDSNVHQARDGELVESQENKTNADTDTEPLVLLDHLEKIGTAHEKSGIMPDSGFDVFVETIRTHIDFVCEKLHIDALQAVLFADIISSSNGYDISQKDLANHIGCKPIKIHKYFDALTKLEDKKLIAISQTESVFDEKSICLEISFETMDSLREGKLPESSAIRAGTIDDFFSQLARLCEDCVQHKIRYAKILREMGILLENGRHFDIVKKLKSYGLLPRDEFMLLRFCHYLVDLDEDEMEYRQLQAVHSNVSEFRTTKRQLELGTHVLQKQELIQNVNNGGFGNAEAFCLTDKAKDELLTEVEDQLVKRHIRGLKPPDEIPEKKLFYPSKTAAQIVELTDLLREENFSKIQKRLSSEGMRIGFACLLSGGPGTGKTETVYQIARQTGRGVMQLDISETKSMWFGESEKKIKAVFTRYRSVVKRADIVPILFFNEADAVIGKRQNLGENRNGPGQTENTIQNIILQEIENLNGILIATTNLLQNMDKAFERRFLYKIEFEKPTLEIRKSIWQAIIPCLSPAEIEILSSQFDFSGGQIENIARRRTVAEIIYGYPPLLETLVEYCKEEQDKKTRGERIGFSPDA